MVPPSFATLMHQRFCTRVPNRARSTIDSTMDVVAALDGTGITTVDIQDSNHLTDILAYALDLALLGQFLGKCNPKFNACCIDRSETLFLFLTSYRFEYFTSGIMMWERSRFHNIEPLIPSIECHSLPPYIGAQHMCWNCVLVQQPCSHPCCKAWFIYRYWHQVQFSECINVLGDDVTPSSSMPITDVDTITPTTLETPTTSKPTHTSAPPHVPQSSGRKLRPVRAPGTYTNLVCPLKISKGRLRSLLGTLSKDTGKFHETLQLLAVTAMDGLTTWSKLSNSDKANLIHNIHYAATIIGKHASQSVLHNIRVVKGPPFMQTQGSTAWCGLCALNNAAGSQQFTVGYLDDIADKLWLDVFDEVGNSPLYYYEPMRSVDGNYNIEVLLRAAAHKGYEIKYLNNEVKEYLQASENDAQQSSLPNSLCGNSKLILRHTTAHYTTLLFQDECIWHIDSKKHKPHQVSLKQLVLGPLKTRTTRTSIFAFSRAETNNAIVTTVCNQQIDLECHETLQLSDDEKEISVCVTFCRD